MQSKKLFFPIIDNGLGIARTTWAVSFAFACLSVLRKYEVTLQHISYPYCAGALNIASNDFLASGADEMVVIDTDIVFKPQQLEWLLGHDEPLVFGIYPKKEIGLKFPMEWLTEENPFAVNPLAEGVQPLVEVKRIARGFMRIARQAFEVVAGNVPTYIDPQTQKECREFWGTLPGGHSEDFAFCDLWRAKGGRVLVDQRIVAQHEGTAVYPIPGTF